MKVKVVEIDVAKLDPNAVHLIVFHAALLSMSQKRAIVKQMANLGVKAVYTEAIDPASALKVYAIPKGKTVATYRGKPIVKRGKL